MDDIKQVAGIGLDTHAATRGHAHSASRPRTARVYRQRHAGWCSLARRIACVGVLLLLAPSAWAQDECANHFMHDDFVAGKPTRLATFVKLNGTDVKASLESLREVAEHDGFHIEKLELNGSEGDLLFWQGKNGQQGSFPVMAKIAGPVPTLSMVVLFPPDMTSKPDMIRDNMCGMIARAGIATSGADPAQQAGGRTQPPGDSRTAPPSTAPKPLNVLTPSAAFDVAAAKAALEEGDSVITGTACSVHDNVVNFAKNRKVLLFPVTPYLQQAVDLMHKAKPGRDTVELSPEMRAVKLEGMTNEKGQFRFARMKPGKYFLMTMLGSAVTRTRDVNVGTGVSGDISVDIYQKQNYQVDFADMLEKYVTIDKSGQTVELTLQPRRTLNLFRDSGASILGCHEAF